MFFPSISCYFPSFRIWRFFSMTGILSRMKGLSSIYSLGNPMCESKYVDLRQELPGVRKGSGDLRDCHP